MSSNRALAYRPPIGFVLTSSRRPEVDVYTPAGTVERCGGCTGFRTATPCPRCGSDEVLTASRVPLALDEDAARAALVSHVKRGRGPTAARIAPLELCWMPCATDGRVLGDLPLSRVPVVLGTEPTEVPTLTAAPAPLEGLVVQPLYRASFRFAGTEHTLVVHGHTGEVTGQVPLDHHARQRRALGAMGLLATFGVCAGLPTLPMLGFGALVWLVCALGIAWAQRRWRRGPPP